MRYVNEIQAGLAHVNIHTGFKDPGLPFGGWKESGAGLPENARTGLDFFVDQKAVSEGIGGPLVTAWVLCTCCHETS